jgi:DNA modification methylase
MKIKDLSPNAKNPRTVTDSKLAMLKKAVAEFGDLSGIIFNRKSQQLVGGHQRQKVIDPNAVITIVKKYSKPTKTGTVAEGYIEVDGERFSYREVYWTDPKEKAANIAANKGAGEWDLPQLSEWMKELGSFDLDFDINLTMFDDEEVKELTGIEVQAHTRISATGADEDDVPEKAPPRTQLGDVYQLGDHRLMCGDATNALSVARLMKGELADLVFTDPPYGVDYQGGHNKKKRSGIKNDKLENQDLTDLFHLALDQAVKFTKDHAAFYVWYANGKAVETYASFSKLPLKVRAVLCWYKVNSGLGAFMSQYIPNYEPCIYAHKDGCAPQWLGPTDEKTVWELKREGRNEFHPTQKPVALAERAILNSSKITQTVLDLFGGSGATLIAAEKTSRKCRMMELDPHYCDVVVERWEKYTGRKARLIARPKLKKSIKAAEQVESRSLDA